jgi:uncharacterized cupredoxin-like copper-binding protein
VRTRIVLPLTMLALVTALVLALPAWVGAAPQSQAAITVTMTEMKFKFSKSSAKKGPITFRLVNKGSVVHDLKIGGKTSPKVAPGKTVTWKVTIAKPGSYPVICTLPGHAPAGMKAAFKVTA